MLFPDADIVRMKARDELCLSFKVMLPAPMSPTFAVSAVQHLLIIFSKITAL
jgi:hypothetical protein